MMNVPREVIDAFVVLAPYAEPASAVCLAAAEQRFSGSTNIEVICSASNLPLARSGDVLRLLESGLSLRLFQRISTLSWDFTARQELYASLSLMLFAAVIYRRKVHRDDNLVEVVLTRPSHASKLEETLAIGPYRTFGLEQTDEMFVDMASRAEKRFTIMTPFLDEFGAQRVVSFFKRAQHEVKCQLVLRSLEDGKLPQAYYDIESDLQRVGVSVYDYRLASQNGTRYETFHMKAVMVHNNWCYVGSANMTAASFSYSTELGLTVRGRAADCIAAILDAITSIARRQM